MTIHETIAAAAAATCALCGTGTCVCGPAGVHLCRLARARADGLITARDFTSVICDAEVFTGTTVVLDPAVPGR